MVYETVQCEFRSTLKTQRAEGPMGRTRDVVGALGPVTPTTIHCRH
jgi:hypothetical protein